MGYLKLRAFRVTFAVESYFLYVFHHVQPCDFRAVLGSVESRSVTPGGNAGCGALGQTADLPLPAPTLLSLSALSLAASSDTPQCSREIGCLRVKSASCLLATDFSRRTHLWGRSGTKG